MPCSQAALPGLADSSPPRGHPTMERAPTDSTSVTAMIVDYAHETD